MRERLHFLSKGAPLGGLTLALLGGCVSRLPPPEAPSRDVPRELVAEATARPSAEGQGVVVLDVVDGASRVEDLGSEADGAHATEICERTPCLARLAVGEHRLVFHHAGRDDEVTLTVGSSPRAHRRVMSYDSGEHREYLALAIGGLVIGGALTAIIGPIAATDFGQMGTADVGLLFGGALASAALLVGVVGLVLAIVDPQQVREGASLEWDLAP